MSYFQEQYDRLPPQWKRYVDARDRQEGRDRAWNKYMTYLQDRGYGSDPVTDPVAPKAPVYNFADSQEVRATINHLEHRLNTHSHSKKGKGQSDAF